MGIFISFSYKRFIQLFNFFITTDGTYTGVPVHFTRAVSRLQIRPKGIKVKFLFTINSILLNP